jgi:hypothetical protein
VKFNINDKVTWVSRSGGYEKMRTGIIIGTCLAGKRPQSVHPDLESLPDRSSRWAGGYAGVSTNDRYVIAVSRGGKSNLTDFYMPRITTVDKQQGEQK